MHNLYVVILVCMFSSRAKIGQALALPLQGQCYRTGTHALNDIDWQCSADFTAMYFI